MAGFGGGACVEKMAFVVSVSSNACNLVSSGNAVRKHIASNKSSVPMFEGKHIHYSPVDQKPLCSYSGKLCKQRRINGYAFCIRHILEDKSSPFKQCSHVAKYNNNKCTNPIPSNEEREYCNSHMQASGMVPKKERKEKNNGGNHHLLSNHLKNNTSLNMNKCGETTLLNSSTAVGVKSSSVTPATAASTVSISVSSSALPLTANAVTSSITASLGTVGGLGSSGSLKITIPTTLSTSSNIASSSSSLNSTSNKHIINEKLKSLIAGEFDLMRMKNASPVNGKSSFAVVGNKKSDNTITISITSTNTTPISQQSNDNCSQEVNKASKAVKETRKKCSSKKRKINLSKLDSSQKMVYALRKESKHDSDDLFNYSLYSSSSGDEEEFEECNDIYKNLHQTVTMSQRFVNDCEDFEVTDLRNRLISQKWLLTNFVKLREQEVLAESKAVKNEIERQLRSEASKSYLEQLLEQKEARIASKTDETSDVLRRGVCCYSNETDLCSKPSLPYTRHCQQHILYNTDQLLFERCVAKCSSPFTLCSKATFDVESDEPLCHYHKKMQNTTEDECGNRNADGELWTVNRLASSSLPIAQKGRKKPKSVTAAKGRRSKKKRRSTSVGKDGNSSLDSIGGSLMSQDSSDGTTFDSCDGGKVELSSAKFNLITASSLPSTTSIITSSSGIQPSRTTSDTSVYATLPVIPPISSTLTQPVAPTERRSTTSNRIEIPASLDVGVPNLAPGDEALVASLVADLPPLGAAPEVGSDTGPPFVDTDLIPDDAFNDLFMDNLKNGDIPSKEEAEALEQALAAVSKDVHNLAVAAAVVSSGTTSTTNYSPGEGAYYHHPINGQSGHQFHTRPGATTPLNMTETDILGLASNILGSLTTEQQQQLNGLIDGALASGSLTSSPTLKSALASLTNDTLAPLTPPGNCVNTSTPLHPNLPFSGPVIARSVVTAPTLTTMHNITLPSPPPYAAQYNPPSAAVYSHELSSSPATTAQTPVSGLLLSPLDYQLNQTTTNSYSSNIANATLVNGKLPNASLLIPMNGPPSGQLPVLRTPVALPVVNVKASLETKLS